MILTELLYKLQSCRSVKLDATPAGQPVYEKFGFRDEYTIDRMTNPKVHTAKRRDGKGSVEPAGHADLNRIIALDSEIFGAERSLLLKSLIREFPYKAWMVKEKGDIAGFSLGRQGTRFHHIGPVFARSAEIAGMIVESAVSELQDKAVVVDVLSDKTKIISFLLESGFSRQRHFVRMFQEKNPFPGKPENQYLICGPEFG